MHGSGLPPSCTRHPLSRSYNGHAYVFWSESESASKRKSEITSSIRSTTATYFQAGKLSNFRLIATASSREIRTFTKCASRQHAPGVEHSAHGNALGS